MTTAAGPLVLAVVVSACRRPHGQRARVLSAHVAVALGLSAAFSAPLFQTRDPTFGLAALAPHEGRLARSRFFRVTLRHRGHVVAAGIGQTGLQGPVRAALPVPFGVVAAWGVR